MSNSASTVKKLELPQEGFVRLPEVLSVFPVGRSTLWAGVKAGRYPAPVKLAPRVTAWRVSDIRRLLEGCATRIKNP